MMRFRPVAVLALASQAFAAPAAAQLVAVRPPEFSTGLALLTFDSAWSRINSTYYDSSFNGVDWPAVRRELRPRARAARSIDELRAVIRDMLGRLGQSHYTLIASDVADATGPVAAGDGRPDPRVPGDAGLELRLAEGRLVTWRIEPGGPADLAGVAAGWVVSAIDGYTPAEALAQLDSSGAAAGVLSTRFLFSANARLDGPAGSSVELALEGPDGRRVTRRIVRRPHAGQPIRFGELPTFWARLDHHRIEDATGCIGFIRFNVWMVPLVREFDLAIDDLRDCRGIVIDLRGNPGGVAGMVMGVAGHFLDEPATLGTMRSRGSALNFVANPRRVDTSAHPVQPYAGPLALLIDPMSVSTTEIFTAGMQSLGRARVFGENSAGQALPAATIRLPDGDVLMHVVADFTARDGVRIEGRGVRPDVAIPLARAPLLAGLDPVLDAAIAWIRASPRVRP